MLFPNFRLRKISARDAAHELYYRTGFLRDCALRRSAAQSANLRKPARCLQAKLMNFFRVMFAASLPA
jgi:hypothetical protein